MSKPSPEELGSPHWQNQRKVSTYLRQVELLEIQLEAYAQLPNWILDGLAWSPHPVWNWPQSGEDPGVWQAIWERWARGQQARYRKLIPGQTPETPVADAMRQPVKIDHDTGPTPPAENPAPTRQAEGGAVDLQNDEPGRSQRANRIVRSY